MSDTRPGMGHNSAGAPAPAPLLVVEGLADDLRLTWNHLFVRRDELLASVNDWAKDHPNGIADEHDAKQATDVLGQLLREIDAVDKSSSVGIRAEVKEPVLAASRIIDGIFKGELADRLRAVLPKLQAPLTKHAKEQRDKAEAERQKAIAEQQETQRKALLEQQQREQEAQAAVDLASRQAAATMSPEDLDAAVAAEEAAMNAAADQADVWKAPAQKLPDPVAAGRVYGDLGTMSSLRGSWKAIVKEPALVPREYCTFEQGLIDAAMKASIPGKGKAPTIKIPGVVFEFDEKLSTRR